MESLSTTTWWASGSGQLGCWLAVCSRQEVGDQGAAGAGEDADVSVSVVSTGRAYEQALSTGVVIIAGDPVGCVRSGCVDYLGGTIAHGVHGTLDQTPCSLGCDT